MPLQYDLSPQLEEKLKKLLKHDKRRYEIIMKKIEKIVESDELTIDDLSDRKRVHIDKSFVLTFEYNKAKKHILFLDFDHHDNIYKK